MRRCIKMHRIHNILKTGDRIIGRKMNVLIPMRTANKNEIIRINTDARHIALQVALLIPILAGGLGLLNSFRMMRLPDPAPSGIAEGAVLG